MEDEARKRRFDGEQIPPPAHGSKQLQAIVLKACAYDPRDRFASAADMLEALKALKGDISPVIVTVPNGETASVAGGVAASVATDELTSGMAETEGRRKQISSEEGTIDAFGVGVVNTAQQRGRQQNAEHPEQHDGTYDLVQPTQQTKGQSAVMPVASLQEKEEEKKKKRRIVAWIAATACLAVVIGGVLFLAPGKGKGDGNQNDTRAVLNYQTSEPSTITPTTPTESAETLPVQHDWTEWADELPDYVTDNDYTIEERTLYRSRNLDTTSSTTSDKMDGWELYDTATVNDDYGSWSDWSKTVVSKSDTRDVETQTRYRYRNKEEATGSTPTMSGWTLENTTYSWSDWGKWSDWSTTAAAASDSRQVETQTRYRYRDKETKTSTSSSMAGWTLYSSNTSWGAWGSWSDWSTNSVSSNDGRQVETKTQYRYRDSIEDDSYEDLEYGPWSSWSDTYYSGSNSRQVETRTLYRFRTRTESLTYYYYRWSDWSSWSTTAVSGNDNRDVQTATYYRYRVRSSVPTYHFSKCNDWSAWSTDAVSESSTRKVETDTFYRYRDRVTQTTYYFQRWTDWSDYSDSPVEESSTVEVQTKVEYRYKSKE
jgi:hypothetical protein